MWMMTWIRASFAASAIFTGRLLSIDILVTSVMLIMALKTAEPTRPVAPVKMRCIVVDPLFSFWLGEKEEGADETDEMPGTSEQDSRPFIPFVYAEFAETVVPKIRS